LKYLEKLLIIPHKGTNGIILGSSRSEVLKTLGKPDFQDEEKDYYYDNCFQVFYDDNDCVEYVECSTGIKYDVIFNGINIFKT